MVEDNYDIVQNGEGSICHHVTISLTLHRAFFQAERRHKGWTDTIKDR